MRYSKTCLNFVFADVLKLLPTTYYHVCVTWAPIRQRDKIRGPQISRFLLLLLLRINKYKSHH